MERRDLTLSTRVEDVRDPRPSCIVHFELVEIKAHFDESLLDIQKQFSIANELQTAGKIEECKNIWRSQVVFLEGILDFYLHELSKYALFKMFTGEWTHSEKFASLQVPMPEVERAIESAESKEWFFEYLNKRFSRDVFLSHEAMSNQLNLIGIGFNNVMKVAYPKPTENQSRTYGKKVVQNLFDRRNAIAHQVDRKHESAEKNDIDQAFVEQCISDVKLIVTTIHNIAEKK
jgi:cob(I)alamin adenosyltransferase